MTSNPKIILDITMSLDGFIAGLNDYGKPLHDWLFSGNTPSAYNDFFKLSKKSASLFDNFIKTTGAIVAGRRTYDITGGWGGNHPFPGVPVFVVSSSVPKKVPEKVRHILRSSRMELKALLNKPGKQRVRKMYIFLVVQALHNSVSTQGFLMK